MKVRYIIEDIKELYMKSERPNEQRFFEGFISVPVEIDLTFDKVYTVIGIEVINEGDINYMLIDDTQSSIPRFYPSSFFEIVDFRASRLWKLESDLVDLSELEGKAPLFVTVEEILINQSFFDDLVNGERENVVFMENISAFLNNEFPEDDFADAESLSDGWVMCNECQHVWRNDSNLGVISCPRCNHLNNNPLWK